MVTAAYDRADVLYQLAIEEAVLGRQDKLMVHLGALRASVVIIAAADGDQWPYAYLPGPLTVAGQAVDAKVTYEMLDADATRLDAAQMTAEALAIKGDQAAYAAEVDRMWALLPAAQAELMAEAGEDWIFDGTYSGWFIMRMFRDAGDLANARRFAGFDWQDPAEHAGVLAMLAQMEAWKGEQAKAKAALDQAGVRLAQAVKKFRDNPDTYYADLDTHLPELVAAKWMLEGQEAALRYGRDTALPETIWEDAAYAHAATMLRRTGKPDDAKAALDLALARPLNVGDEPMNWDVMHLTRELVRQDRMKDLEAYLARSQSPAFRAFGSLGAAQALLHPDK